MGHYHTFCYEKEFSSCSCVITSLEDRGWVDADVSWPGAGRHGYMYINSVDNPIQYAAVKGDIISCIHHSDTPVSHYYQQTISFCKVTASKHNPITGTRQNSDTSTVRPYM